MIVKLSSSYSPKSDWRAKGGAEAHKFYRFIKRFIMLQAFAFDLTRKEF